MLGEQDVGLGSAARHAASSGHAYTNGVNVDAHSEDMPVKKLMAVSPMDNVGNPEPAVLMDAGGSPVGDATSDAPERWSISALAPVDPFVQFLMSPPDCQAGVLPLATPGGGGLLIVLSLGKWQHRVLLPLFGATVADYLAALKRTGLPIGVVLTASGLSEARRFDVSVQEDTLDQGVAIVVRDLDPDHTKHRREMAEMCLLSVVPRTVPRDAFSGFPDVVTLSRVWPPELPPYGTRQGRPKGQPPR